MCEIESIEFELECIPKSLNIIFDKQSTVITKSLCYVNLFK